MSKKELRVFRPGAEILASKLMIEAEINPDDVVTFENGLPNLTPARKNFGDPLANEFKNSVEKHVYTKGKSGLHTEKIIEIYNAQEREKRETEEILAKRAEKRKRLEDHKKRQNMPRSYHKYSARNKIIKGRGRVRRKKGKLPSQQEKMQNEKKVMWENREIM